MALFALFLSLHLFFLFFFFFQSYFQLILPFDLLALFLTDLFADYARYTYNLIQNRAQVSTTNKNFLKNIYSFYIYHILNQTLFLALCTSLKVTFCYNPRNF